MCLAIIPHKATIITVADPGEGPRGSTPPYFWTKLRPEGPKKFFLETPPFLRVWMTPPYLKVWIRHCIKYLSLSIGLGECSCLATREHVTNHHKPAWLFEWLFRGQEMLLVINFEDRSSFNRIWK